MSLKISGLKNFGFVLKKYLSSDKPIMKGGG